MKELNNMIPRDLLCYYNVGGNVHFHCEDCGGAEYYGKLSDRELCELCFLQEIERIENEQD